MTADERSTRVLEDSEVERVLVVTAHPDGADFGAAGTISGWTAAGIEVTYCVCTDGDAGGFEELLAPLREGERDGEGEPGDDDRADQRRECAEAEQAKVGGESGGGEPDAEAEGGAGAAEVDPESRERNHLSDEERGEHRR